MVEDLLRKYRPSGPPPDLRARIVTREYQVWRWATAAAALLVVAMLLHRAADRLLVTATLPMAQAAEAQIEELSALLGGTPEARRLAETEIMRVRDRAAEDPAQGTR